MLQEATHELFGGHSGKFDLLSGRVFVLESNAALIELDDALVGDGDTEDVRGEILEGGQATADRLRMNHPSLLPDLLRHLLEQITLAQLLAKLGSEDWGEGFDRHEEIFACSQPALLLTPATASDNEV